MLVQPGVTWWWTGVGPAWSNLWWTGGGPAGVTWWWAGGGPAWSNLVVDWWWCSWSNSRQQKGQLKNFS